jgi:uncharacterized LabA/DUF88 family protein
MSDLLEPSPVEQRNGQAQATNGGSVVSRHQRMAVFVDVQNMFYSAKHQFRAKLNFQKLLDAVTRDRELVRAIAYIVQNPDIDQSSFITMLQQNGYEVRSKSLRLRPDGTAKGDWDMGIAIDTIAMSDRLDTIVLVSGDGDFVDLVHLLKARGLRVEIFSFPYSTAEELRTSATEFYQIGPDLLMQNFFPPRPPNARGEPEVAAVTRRNGD